ASGGNLALGRGRRSSGHPPRETEPREGDRRIGPEPSRLSGQLSAALRREPIVTAQAAPPAHAADGPPPRQSGAPCRGTQLTTAPARPPGTPALFSPAGHALYHLYDEYNA